MEQHTQRFAVALLRAVATRLPSDFAGLGVIFYDQLAELHFLSLDVHSDIGVNLPTTGRESIAETLARVSSLSSGWHDGFHFVDVRREALTHLAQFVSPPLPLPPTPTPKASGARHMTAVLASRVQGVLGAGILTNRSEISYFSHGHCVICEHTT